MKVLVDGDSCRYVQVIENVCKALGIDLDFFHNYNVELDIEYGNDHVTGCEKDAADFAIMNHASKYDIVVTDDYGLSNLVIGKGCFVINRFGSYVTDDILNGTAASKWLMAKQRRGTRLGKNKSPRKFDIKSAAHGEKHHNFELSLKYLILRALDTEKEADCT